MVQRCATTSRDADAASDRHLAPSAWPNVNATPGEGSEWAGLEVASLAPDVPVGGVQSLVRGGPGRESMPSPLLVVLVLLALLQASKRFVDSARGALRSLMARRRRQL